MTEPATDVRVPPAPPTAVRLFGAALPAAERYAALLARDATVRGLIGPREVTRLWDRHLVNCAQLGELVPRGVRVVDVGSGAGLPGIALALARPDLAVDLVEPLLRRTTFLGEVVVELRLGERVRVVRGRADEPAVLAEVGGADVVTARAVAPLARLVQWSLPLLGPSGRVLAVKGRTAAAEVAESAAEIRRLGGSAPVVHTVGLGDDRTVVIEIQRESRPAGRKGGS